MTTSQNSQPKPLSRADLSGRIAVVTGAGDGIGRSLSVLLAGLGCHVAGCDISDEGLEATAKICVEAAPPGTRVTMHRCDVSDEDQMMGFRDEVVAQHETDHVDLVFLNAGVAGGGSMVNDDRAAWELTFNVCWGGVYLGTRAFLPLLIASEHGHLINTSSVNGFFASLGPETPHTAYSAAKFAVKGFSEALITDLRLNAPHVGVSVVMPGHIGTGIAENTRKLQSELAGGVDDPRFVELGKVFRETAPTSAEEAAAIMLDGALARRWRILVGDDAHALDEDVRANPEQAYELDFRRAL